ncbi:MAG: c-type cytochrome [Imperialibacter sp.]|uniref:DUF7133 domain-containing protein n=1 Tax=Imperialibacter sp. TaxID=2038411 RepID=UPI0032EB478C
MKKYISLIALLVGFNAFSQEAEESDFYKIITIPTPETMLLEVGGITTLPDGRVALATRRGDVWMVEDPYMRNSNLPSFTLFASGLHEPLGLAFKENALLTAQRGELTKLQDTNGDGRADVYETIYAWPVSGHYHEYSYGPKIAPDGSMFVSGNVAFGDQEWWRGESRVPWRGWIMRISPEGNMEPWATGMRSPAGLGMINGELFYADNQGDWIGSGGVWHIKKGSFTGHPAGLKWADREESPVTVSAKEFYAKVHEEREQVDGRYLKPENNADEKNPEMLYHAKESVPEITLPAVWLPHGILGISNSEILEIGEDASFGPFKNQLLIGDQGQSKIMRVSLEKVNGDYQGVAFDFIKDFQSGVLRMSWGHDGSLFVGETNRGWGSAGSTTSGLERVVWTGETPFEMQTVKAMPDGFEIRFTQPVDKATAEDLDSYAGQSFIYKYHSVYGSPPINTEKLGIKGVKVAEDGMSVRLVVDNLRQYYVHEINLPGIKSANGSSVLHGTGYYTLNNIPAGAKLNMTEVSTKRSSASKKVAPKKVAAKPAAPKASANAVLTTEEIKPILAKNTCLACHQVDKRQVGPAYKDIAARRYTAKQIVDLIRNPKAENWPGYSTEMPPMPQVSDEDAMKIANWIISLQEERP